MDNPRLDWPILMLTMATMLGDGRSTCQRLQVGCIITTPEHDRVISFGYNGSNAGGPNRCDSPDTPGKCGCIHSEANALLKAGEKAKGAFVYITHSPCLMCAKMLINAKVSRVIYGEEYRYPEGVTLLEDYGIECININTDEQDEAVSKWEEALHADCDHDDIDDGPISAEEDDEVLRKLFGVDD